MPDDVEYMDLQYPLPGCERWIRVIMPRTVTSAEWQYLANLVEVLRPGVVLDPPRPGSLLKIASEATR